ncbi:MAG: tyrosine-protein phosphatase [Syntrophobacterales bacterium]|jgi:protein-tyrosine phosphatase
MNRHILVALIVLFTLTGCATPPPDHHRSVKVSAARNFRDLGGYATADGHHIKKGLLYRSDHLKKVSTGDVEVIVALGVKTVYDFRSEKEREKDPPTLSKIGSLEVVSLPIYYAPMDPALTRRKILRGEVEKGEFHQAMIESYRAYVLDYRVQLSTFMIDLSDPSGLPALIHCTHGKDRTGVAVAITLRALGVPRETVMEDYLLSNKFWQSEARRLSCFASFASFFRTPRSEVRALLEVRPEYLEAAFAAIDEHYGSFENYLDEGLGIDEPTLQRLRKALLD